MSGTNEVIGALAFWDCRELVIKRSEFRSALEEIDLGFAMPKDPKPAAMLRAAMDSLPIELREAFDVATVGDSLVCYSKHGRITMNRSTGELSSTSNHPTHAAALDHYVRTADRLTVSEAGTILTHAIRGRAHDIGLAGVNVRGESGGVYFVPRANLERLRLLASATCVGFGPPRLSVWGVYEGQQERRLAFAIVNQDLRNRLAHVMKSISQILEVEATERGSRGIQARWAIIRDLGSRIAVYRDVFGDDLGVSPDDVEALVDRMNGGGM